MCASAWWLLSFCREAIKKEEELSIAPSKIDIFSQQDEPLFMPPTRLLVVLASISQLLFTRLSALRCNVFATFSLFTLLSIAGQVNLSNCFLSQHLTQPLAHHRLNLPLQHCGLPVCSWQDGKWIKEEKMSASLRDTDEPGTWCFVLSSF